MKQAFPYQDVVKGTCAKIETTLFESQLVNGTEIEPKLPGVCGRDWNTTWQIEARDRAQPI